MRKNLFLIASLIMPLAFVTGCDSEGLKAPELYVNSAKTGLAWTEVKGADHYEVTVNDNDPREATKYSFAKDAGHYNVRVRAVDKNGTEGPFSDKFSYTVKATNMGEIDADGTTVYYSVDTVALYVTCSINGGEEITVENKEVEVTERGVYIFTAHSGYDEEDATYYVDGENTKSFYLYIPNAEEDYAIDLGDRHNDYNTYTYNGSSYVTTTDTLVQQTSEAKTGGNATEFVVPCDTTSYKFSKEISVSERYQTLELYVKSNAPDGVYMNVNVGFGVTLDNILGYDFSEYVSSAYLTYPLGRVSSWTKNSLLLTSNNWELHIGNQSFSLITLNLAISMLGYDIQLNSFADFLLAFNSFDVVVTSGQVANGETASVIVDDVRLGA